MKIVINESQEKKLIREYLDKHYGMPLLQYLSKSDDDKVCEIIQLYYYDFYLFVKTQVEPDLYGIEEDEYNEILADAEERCKGKEDKALIDDIIDGKYKMFRNDFANFEIRTHFYELHKNPPWMYLENPSLVANEWLIHFSDNAYQIAKEGFGFGTSKRENIAYSGAGDIKNKFGEGYDFAYTLNDYANSYNNYDPTDRLSSAEMTSYYDDDYDGEKIEPKYGKDAVIFRASGVRVWHNGDKEHQVIFWGPSAKDFIYLNNDNGIWKIKSIKSNKTIYCNNSIEKVVNWAINNLSQYSKHILDTTGNKRNKNYEKNYE